MTAFLASLPPDPNVLLWLPPTELPFRKQVRRIFEATALAGLADNIRTHGVIQPIVCYLDNGKVVVLDGERRVRASIMAALARVPVRLLHDPLDIAKVRARQLAANLQRESLNLIEQAEGFQTFMDESGLTGERVAAELGLSPSKVCRTLTLNTLSPEHKQLVVSGKVSGESAYLLTRVDDPARRDALAQRVAAGELSRGALTAEVRAWETAKSAPATTTNGAAEKCKRSPSTVAVWRMTRTIGLGVALAVTGTALTLEELVTLLEAFVARAREGIAQNIPVARFLSEFRYDVPAAKGATP